jgi:ATP synthase protein I
MAAKSLKKMIQHEAYRIVLLQLNGVLVLALLALAVSGLKNGFSVLAGGLSYGLPNLVFVWLVFRFAGAHQMAQFMMAFFMGEMLKLILSAILFLVIVKTLPVSLLSTLIGFVGAIISFWIVCMFHFSRKAVPKENILRS